MMWQLMLLCLVKIFLQHVSSSTLYLKQDCLSNILQWVWTYLSNQLDIWRWKHDYKLIGYFFVRKKFATRCGSKNLSDKPSKTSISCILHLPRLSSGLFASVFPIAKSWLAELLRKKRFDQKVFTRVLQLASAFLKAAPYCPLTTSLQHQSNFYC